MNEFKIIQENIKKGDFQNSLKNLESIYNKNNNNLDCIFLLGNIYYKLNEPKNSLFYYKKYNQLNPNNILVLLNIGMIFQNLGKFDDAKKIYSKIININPNVVRAYYGLFSLDENYVNEDVLKKLIFLNSKKEISLFDKSLINLIISKYYKKKNNITKEIEYLNQSHKQSYDSNLNYNRQSDFYYNEIIPKFFNKIKFTKKNGEFNKYTKSNIIFIIGLPRSGSTFVESLLAQSSNNIKSVGEFHAVNMSIFDQIAEKIYSPNFDFNSFEFELDLGLFLNSLKKKYTFSNNHIILDKSLENFFNIELILKIFPNAKFLHTFRNYDDSVIAIYQSMLSELSWSHNIKSIKKYINNYKNVIGFFKTKYPKNIIDIDIQQLTNSTELEAEKIFKFCNLIWNNKYLNFSNKKNFFSKTLSFKQIRSKIDKYDDNKYKKYYNLI